MSDNKLQLANKIYRTLCSSLKNRGWRYEKKESDLVVIFDVRGEDIPMHFIVLVDAERKLIRLLSPFPFKMSEDKIMEGCVAACSANYGLVDGSFDYDINDGSVLFRMTVSYRGSDIGEDTFGYLIDCACSTVDTYNDKFLALNKGLINITDFLKNA